MSKGKFFAVGLGCVLALSSTTALAEYLEHLKISVRNLRDTPVHVKYNDATSNNIKHFERLSYPIAANMMHEAVSTALIYSYSHPAACVQDIYDENQTYLGSIYINQDTWYDYYHIATLGNVGCNTSEAKDGQFVACFVAK